MKRSLRLLLVEDSSDDAVLLLRELRAGNFVVECTRVATEEDMARALHDRPLDLIICDYVIPGFGGREALELFRGSGLDIPFILISGHIGEEMAVAALKAGADDYLMKDRLTRLVPAVERALAEAERRREHRRADQALRRSEEQLRQLNEMLEKRVQERTADLRVANNQLLSQINERKRLEAELLDIAENERRRIGFDLHDDIGQRLMGVSMLVKALEQKLEQKHLPDANMAQRVSTLLDQVINHTHDLAECFSSLDPGDHDLGRLIRKLVENVNNTFEVGCQLRTLDPVPPLQPDTALQLYKIAQEAVGNAVQHGKARQIHIVYGGYQKYFLLQVANDGVPYQASEDAGQQLGLRIMAYRAHTIGGRLDVRANGDSGTRVTCLLRLTGGSESETAGLPFLAEVARQTAHSGRAMANLNAA